MSWQDSRQLKLIVGAGTTDGLRWARQHLYALLVLAPLVLGMTYFGVGRLVHEAGWSPTPRQAAALSVLAAACLLVSSLSRAAAEVYHTRRPESALDTLPVAPAALLVAALARRVARNALVGAFAAVARGLVGGGPWDFEPLASLALFVALLSLCEVFAALHWIHWGHRRAWGQAASAVLLSAAGAFVCGLLLLSVVKPSMLDPVARAAAQVAGFLLSAALLPLALTLHGRWRAGDIEYAKRLRERGRTTLPVDRLARRACGKDRAAAAQLARDLRLTLRGFSSAVYAAAGVAALWIVMMAAVLLTVSLPARPAAAESWTGATWLPSVLVVKGACVLACVSLACLVPVLVSYQTPHLWLERAAGAAGGGVARAKLAYARVITLPAAASAWAVGLACGAAPAFYAMPLLAECLWLWWLVSTLAGGLAYEMPEEPGLSLVLVACATLAAGGLTAFLWPMGLALYAFGLPQLLMRGQHRAHMHLREAGG